MDQPIVLVDHFEWKPEMEGPFAVRKFVVVFYVSDFF